MRKAETYELLAGDVVEISDLGQVGATYNPAIRIQVTILKIVDDTFTYNFPGEDSISHAHTSEVHRNLSAENRLMRLEKEIPSYIDIMVSI